MDKEHHLERMVGIYGKFRYLDVSLPRFHWILLGKIDIHHLENDQQHFNKLFSAW